MQFESTILSNFALSVDGCYILAIDGRLVVGISAHSVRFSLSQLR